MNMSIQRTFLYAALVFILSSLYFSWNNPNDGAKSGERTLIDQSIRAPFLKVNPDNTFAIRTKNASGDVESIFYIDKQTGDVVSNQLVNVPETLNSTAPTSLLSMNSNSPFYARSGWLDAEHNVLSGTSLWQEVDVEGDPSILLKLRNEGSDYTLEKIYQSNPDNPFALEVITSIHAENINSPLTLTPFADFVALKEVSAPDQNSIPKPDTFIAGTATNFYSGLFHFNTFTGAAYLDDGQHYKKLAYSNLAKQPLDAKAVPQTWLGIQRRYFLTSWVPDNSAYNLSTQWQAGYVSSDDDSYLQAFQMRMTKASQEILANQGEVKTASFELYSGPEKREYLSMFNRQLDRTIDYGWLHFISLPIVNLMKFYQGWVVNWGLAIVLVTLTLKLLLYKFSEIGYRTTAITKKIAPLRAEINEQFAEDPMAKQQALMALYKKEKVNPLKGCLPLLLQAPLFIALYWVLMESYELLYAKFLWINDLSQADLLHSSSCLGSVHVFSAAHQHWQYG